MVQSAPASKQGEKKAGRIAFTINIILELFLMLDRARLALSSLIAYYNQSPKAAARVRRLDIISLILEGLNVIIIPLVYLEAWIMGQPVPFTLSNNIKWLYSAALFSLALSAFLVPAVAWPLTLALGSLVLAVASLALCTKIYNYFKSDETQKSKAPIVNGMINVGLGALALVGIVLTTFVPPAGIGILLGVSVLTLVYIVGTIGAVMIKKALERVQLANIPAGSSDASIASQLGLSPRVAAQAFQSVQQITLLQNRVTVAISEKEPIAMLKAIGDAAKYCGDPACSADDRHYVREVFESIDEFRTDGVNLLKQGIDDYNAGNFDAHKEIISIDEAITNLKNIPAVLAYIDSKNTADQTTIDISGDFLKHRPFVENVNNP